MRANPIWQLSVVTTDAASEIVAALLEGLLGRDPTSYQDAGSGKVTISLFFQDRPNWTRKRNTTFKTAIKEIQSHGLNTGHCRISIRRLPAEDWAESWKKHFRPILIGRQLLIRPSWLKGHSSRGRQAVLIDPGLSFGTGNHPTTLFCLRQLVENRPKKLPRSFLDIGTGSGILALAAARLAYQPVHAFDFDANAIRTATENLSLNKLDGRVQLFRADLTRLPRKAKMRFDMVCANLQSDVLLACRGQILGRLKEGGTVVLAGILSKEFSRVQSAYEQSGVKLFRRMTGGEWTSGAFR